MRLFILLLLLSPSATFAQSGSSTDIGDTTFYNFDKFSGSRQSIGKTDVYSDLLHLAELVDEHAPIDQRHEFLAAQ
jgi:hypothetical protein